MASSPSFTTEIRLWTMASRNAMIVKSTSALLSSTSKTFRQRTCSGIHTHDQLRKDFVTKVSINKELIQPGSIHSYAIMGVFPVDPSDKADERACLPR